MKVHHLDHGSSEAGIAFKSYRCTSENKPHAIGLEELEDLMMWLERAMGTR
jgi:hypothetical protein